MKVAIILGVLHMIFGLFLNFINHFYFKNYLGLFCGTFPQIIFFLALFGYLVMLFFWKWIKYDPLGSEDLKPQCAPSLLVNFIGMVMFTFEKNERIDCQDEMFPNQELVQQILVVCALFCIPWMLILEPLILIIRIKKKNKYEKQLSANEEPLDLEESETSFIVVHQCIHTIEFVLGSVSYTASYLRLWALSLAHIQLSNVLWDMIFVRGFTIFSSAILSTITVFLTFLIWACLTVAILIIMEGLSAFLHALRLHWMEFQSKFYSGMGYYMSPFSFKKGLLAARLRM